MSVATELPISTLVQRPVLFVHLDDSLRRLAEIFAAESVGAALSPSPPGSRPPNITLIAVPRPTMAPAAGD